MPITHAYRISFVLANFPLSQHSSLECACVFSFLGALDGIVTSSEYPHTSNLPFAVCCKYAKSKWKISESTQHLFNWNWRQCQFNRETLRLNYLSNGNLRSNGSLTIANVDTNFLLGVKSVYSNNAKYGMRWSHRLTGMYRGRKFIHAFYVKKKEVGMC